MITEFTQWTLKQNRRRSIFFWGTDGEVDRKGGLFGFCEAFGEQYKEILEEMKYGIGSIKEKYYGN